MELYINNGAVVMHLWHLIWPNHHLGLFYLGGSLLDDADTGIYYTTESVFAMRLVNLRSVTCYTDQNFNENAQFGALNLFTSEKGWN